VTGPILITGKNGQVGFELQRVFKDAGPTIALDRDAMDLSKPDSLRRTIADLRPSIIINAAAYTAVDLAEEEPDYAQMVNGNAPGIMAEEAKKLGALFIHYSTDYVFDGSKRAPYVETDQPNPINAYGMTKLIGERAIESSGANYLIFRTSWVYSTRGRNFLLTILRLAREREELKIVNDQIGIPNWSHAIAEATAAVIRKIQKKPTSKPSRGRPRSKDLSGIYHMAGSGQTSWFGFAEAILDHIHKGAFPDTVMGQVPITAKRVLPITTAEYPTRARRPAYSVLDSTKLKQTFAVELPPWPDQLKSAVHTESIA
jgi:dTDP-4-dehydrorhamnose reductase